MAEYREGSILARIEELEKRKNDIEDNDFSGLRHHNIAIIEAELKAWKKIKAMVEARRKELLQSRHDNYFSRYRCGCSNCYANTVEARGLTWLLGDGGK